MGEDAVNVAFLEFDCIHITEGSRINQLMGNFRLAHVVCADFCDDEGWMAVAHPAILDLKLRHNPP
jgi:hypothetical protein